MEPVTVVGAGPAGLACAIALARVGRKVVVREWRPQVGHRFHGDFQGLENWSDAQDVLEELREAGIGSNFLHHAVFRVTGFGPDGERHRIESPHAICYVVPRGPEAGTLDHSLLAQALALGAEVRFGDRVEAVDGPAVLAGGPRVADVIAVGYVFETDAADGDAFALGSRLAPLGYAYLLVHGGRGTVAACLFSGFKDETRYLERTVEFFRDKAGLVMQNPRPFGGYGSFRLPDTAVQGGHPVAGEHAGFQDALAGFGMRFALRSGLRAARSIIEKRDYTALWREKLLPLLRAGIVNRFVAATVGEAGWRILMKKLGRGDARARLRGLYSMSAVHGLLFPIARLRYLSGLRDRSCDHVDCGCVWCQCNK